MCAEVDQETVAGSETSLTSFNTADDQDPLSSQVNSLPVFDVNPEAMALAVVPDPPRRPVLAASNPTNNPSSSANPQ